MIMFLKSRLLAPGRLSNRKNGFSTVTWEIYFSFRIQTSHYLHLADSFCCE